ncbi:MAG TPA: cyclic nucleotide-binding domain-containing protein [Burkholderiaceae bacterium]
MFSFLNSSRLPAHLQRLNTLPLFSSLTSRELKIVDSLLHLREFMAGEIVFDEGEEGQALYILLSGTVTVTRSVDGVREVVAELSSGSFFGDLALLDNTPRSAQIKAKEACEMAVFFRADFIALMEIDARIGYKISLQLARNLAQRLRGALQGRPRIEVL